MVCMFVGQGATLTLIHCKEQASILGFGEVTAGVRQPRLAKGSKLVFSPIQGEMFGVLGEKGLSL